jgi:hypothetical protein
MTRHRDQPNHLALRPSFLKWGVRMKALLPLFLFSLAVAIPAQAQASQPSAAKPADAEPGLTLVSAERVYLDARLGTTIEPRLGRYSSHPSGRGAPNAGRAREGLEKAIAKWGRFTVVDDPEKSDLVLVIVEGNRNSGIREGVLTEKLLVARGGADKVKLWESSSHDGGVRDYRPVAKTVDEFRAAVEEYEKKVPKELVAQARAARISGATSATSGGCGNAPSDPLDCIAHQNAALYLPEEREENQGAVKLSQVLLHMSVLDMEKHVSTTEFSNYVVAIQKLLHRQFTTAQRQPGKDIAVQGTLQADGKADFKLASRPQLDNGQMQTLYDGLQKLPRPAVHEGPVEFRAVFQLWGGSEESRTER